jgi:hypothetical protein
VRQKLQLEMPQGSLVIDYQASLEDCPEFALVDSVQGAVSWNDRQSFFIYRRVA